MAFWKNKDLSVKIKSTIDLLFFIKQVSEWTRFAKLKRLQKFSSLPLSELELLISTLKTPINQVFIFTQSFTNYFIHFFKERLNIYRWLRPIYTKTDPLFLWNCKLRTDKLTINKFIFFNLLQTTPCLTNSISPPPCLCLSLLALTSYHISYVYHWWLLYKKQTLIVLRLLVPSTFKQL